MSCEFFVACLLPDDSTNSTTHLSHEDIKSVLYPPLVRFNKARASLVVQDEPDVVLLRRKGSSPSSASSADSVIRLFLITIDDRSGKIKALIDSKDQTILPPLKDEDDSSSEGEEEDSKKDEESTEEISKEELSAVDDTIKKATAPSSGARPVFALLAARLQSPSEWVSLFSLDEASIAMTAEDAAGNDLTTEGGDDEENAVVLVTCPFDELHQINRDEMLAHLTEQHMTECVSFVSDWIDAGRPPMTAQPQQSEEGVASAQGTLVTPPGGAVPGSATAELSAAKSSATAEGSHRRKRHRSLDESDGGKKKRHRRHRHRRSASSRSSRSSSSSSSDGSSSSSQESSNRRHRHSKSEFTPAEVPSFPSSVVPQGAPQIQRTFAHRFTAPQPIAAAHQHQQHPFVGTKLPSPPAPDCNTLHVFCSDADMDPVSLGTFFHSLVNWQNGEAVLQVVYHPSQRCCFIQLESPATATRLLMQLYPSHKIGGRDCSFRWAARWVQPAVDHPRDADGRWMTQVFRGRSLLTTMAHGKQHSSGQASPPSYANNSSLHRPAVPAPPSAHSFPSLHGNSSGSSFHAQASSHQPQAPTTSSMPVRSMMSPSSMVVFVPTQQLSQVHPQQLERTVFQEILRFSGNQIPVYMHITKERVVADMPNPDVARSVIEGLALHGSHIFAQCLAARMTI